MGGDDRVKVRVGEVDYEVTPQMIEFKVVKKRKVGEKVTPSVIEPSFGIGRILYSILEHSFVTRSNDEKRTVCLSPSPSPPLLLCYCYYIDIKWYYMILFDIKIEY